MIEQGLEELPLFNKYNVGVKLWRKIVYGKNGFFVVLFQVKMDFQFEGTGEMDKIERMSVNNFMQVHFIGYDIQMTFEKHFYSGKFILKAFRQINIRLFKPFDSEKHIMILPVC
jgi:hypothetical protein